MSTGTTFTCTCGSRSFIVIHAATGEQVDLQRFLMTQRQQSINPDKLKAHDPLDLSQLRTVCAKCQRQV